MKLLIHAVDAKSNYVLAGHIVIPADSREPITTFVPEPGWEGKYDSLVDPEAEFYDYIEDRMVKPAEGWDYIEALLRTRTTYFGFDLDISEEDLRAAGVDAEGNPLEGVTFPELSKGDATSPLGPDVSALREFLRTTHFIPEGKPPVGG
ncbi:MAG: hypothetical protein PHR35_04555 [Kiritimatiellae bacterium]|nr:hypothetical protein [Kiritimatiellia bacterium]